MKPTPEMIEADSTDRMARALYAAYTRSAYAEPNGVDLSGENLEEWYRNNAAMPLSGPGFVKLWRDMATAALAAAPAQGVRVKPHAAGIEAARQAYEACRVLDLPADPMAEAIRAYLSALEPAPNGVSPPANEVDVAGKYPVAPAQGVPEPITARYTNWRGETALRTIIPHRVFFGSNEWHPEPQVLIEATDVAKGEIRTFAAAGFVVDRRPVAADRLDAAYNGEDAP